jgi:hypothetical protein
MAEGIWLDNFEAGSTAVVAVGTSTNTWITFTSTQDIQASDMLMSNKGSNDVYWAAGTSTGTTTAVVPGSTPVANGTPIEAGSIKSFKKGCGFSVIGLISTGSTCTVNVTAGVGQ